MKRALDITVAVLGLLILSPLLLVALIVIWLQDFSSPFFMALLSHGKVALNGGECT